MIRIRSSASRRIATLEESVQHLEIRTTDNTRAIQSTTANVIQRIDELDNTVQDIPTPERMRAIAAIPRYVAELRAVTTQHTIRLAQLDERSDLVNGAVGSLSGRASALEDRVSELGGRSVWSMLRTR